VGGRGINTIEPRNIEEILSNRFEGFYITLISETNSVTDKCHRLRPRVSSAAFRTLVG
jgi:hypothetical protein